MQGVISQMDIPLDLIRDNPFNLRRTYEEHETRSLAESLSKVGLLNPVGVRQKDSGFELVFGHRRVRAARLLNWKTIRATVGSFSDEQLLEVSLIENIERKDLSDYEKALAFKQMHEEFGKTDEEIGRMVGLSRGAISNYLSMARIFNKEQLNLDPSLRDALYSISEHHARYLNRIEDVTTRAKFLRMVVSESLSVRDLQRITQHLRSWFKPEDHPFRSDEAKLGSLSQGGNRSIFDLMEIQKALSSEFSLPKEGDFSTFANLHAYGDGFSIYSAFAPYEIIRGSRAIAREKGWFTRVVPRFSVRVRDIRIQLFADTALATLCVDYGRLRSRLVKRSMRGSVVFVRSGKSWRIIHEHWSNVRQQDLQALLESQEWRKSNHP